MNNISTKNIPETDEEKRVVCLQLTDEAKEEEISDCLAFFLKMPKEVAFESTIKLYSKFGNKVSSNQLWIDYFNNTYEASIETLRKIRPESFKEN